MTPAQLLAATAADMRKVAEALGDAKRPWFVQNPGGYPQSIRSTGVVYLIADAFDQPPHIATADYIAAWDPTVTEMVAAWLDAKATKYNAYDPDEQARMVETGTGTLAPMLRVCDAWWKSRGMEPREADHG